MFANIRLHPLLIIFILLSFLTGTFVQLFIILLLVFIHELGHYIAAVYYKWRIDYIMLWVFGGVMKTDEASHRPVKEELIVTLAGPLQHVFIYLILQVIGLFQVLPEQLIEQVHYYNVILLLFNLLPIYPLDGGKLLLLCYSAFTAYYASLRTTYLFSILSCSLVLITHLSFYPFTWSAFALSLFLLLENVRAWKDLFFTFIRFLLNRYHSEERKQLVVSTVGEDARLLHILKKIRRTRTHIFKIENHLNTHRTVSEQACLHTYFFHKNITATMSEVNDKNNNV